MTLILAAKRFRDAARELKKWKNKKFASVCDAVEDTAEEAENMRLRSELMAALNRKIEKSSISQASAAKMLGVFQPRISDLRRGKIDLFSLDALVKMATAAGLRIRLQIRGAA